MFINFRARGISRGTRKLFRTPILNKKIIITNDLQMSRFNLYKTTPRNQCTYKLLHITLKLVQILLPTIEFN